MKHWKKMVAPIVIASITIVYYIGIAIFFMHMGVQTKYVDKAGGYLAQRVGEENSSLSIIPSIPTGIKIVMIVVPFILTVVMLGVLISRIKEIQGGEEDDLSQY